MLFINSICLYNKYIRLRHAKSTLRPYCQETNVTISYYNVCDKVVDYSICLQGRYVRYQDTLRPYLIRSMAYRDTYLI